MSLGKLVERIKQAKLIVDRDIETNFNPDTINALRGQKRRAVEELKQLTREYQEELRSTSAFILIAGANRDEFLKQAAADSRALVASADLFYEGLANRIAPEAYLGKTNVSNLFDILTRHLEDKANELGIGRYNQLVFNQKYQRAVKNKEDFTAIIREAINEQVGAEIIGFDAAAQVVEEAIKRGNASGRTPVILTTSSDQLSLEIGDALRKSKFTTYTVVAGKAKKEFKSVPNLIPLAKVTDETTAQALDLIVGQTK